MDATSRLASRASMLDSGLALDVATPTTIDLVRLFSHLDADDESRIELPESSGQT
jgi:hypothetical protein